MLHRSVLVLAATVLFTGFPLISEAIQIAPNPNPAGSTINIVNDPTASNNVAFFNEGTINIDSASTLTNQGALHNSGGQTNNNGTLVNLSGISVLQGQLTNTGTLVNTGGINAQSGPINTSGTLNNTGDIFIHLAGLHNTGTFTSSGAITLHEAGLRNSNTMTNSGSIETLSNGGSMTNEVGGQFTNNGTVSVTSLTNDGIVINDGSVTIQNSVFTGFGTYYQNSGQTINNGTLTLFNGAVNIQGGGLSGLGTIITPSLTLASGASLNPGTDTTLGTLTLNGNLASRGNLNFLLGGLGVGEFDILQINGNAAFTGGSLRFDFVDGFTAAVGNSWKFLYATALSGWDSLGITVNGLSAGLGYEITSVNGAQMLQVVSVPEPGSLLLLGAGLVGLVGLRRKLSKD